MSLRPQLQPYQVITSGNMALTDGITSLVTLIPNFSLVSYTYSWSGSSPVGTVKVQVSNDYALDAVGVVARAGNWADVSFLRGSATASSVALSGSSGSDGIVLPLVGAYAIRLVYTRTSGTGTLQAYICAKVA